MLHFIQHVQVEELLETIGRNNASKLIVSNRFVAFFIRMEIGDSDGCGDT